MENDNKEKKSIFKNKESKGSVGGLRTGRNRDDVSGFKSPNTNKGSRVSSENPLLSQAPRGSKTWNALSGVTKIKEVKPSEYKRIEDNKKRNITVRFNNW